MSSDLQSEGNLNRIDLHLSTILWFSEILEKHWIEAPSEVRIVKEHMV